MEFVYEPNQISLPDAAGNELAVVTFPETKAGVVNINHTFVDDSLRGQGVAGRLMEAVAAQLQAQDKKAVLTCSYAVAWFGKHPEYQDVVVKPEKV